jgi:hypothetical protein
MRDVIGSADMTGGNLTSFVQDRFCNVNSALALNGGWTQVPMGVYFDTPEFTISIWVNPLNVGSYSRIIDFGNGQLDNIKFPLSLGSTLKPYFILNSGTTVIFTGQSSQSLALDIWQFITVTYDGTNAKMYINGTLVANIYQNYTLASLSRSNCYIGKSNWPTDGYSSSYFDDLRFYNKSLSQQEILELMNQNETSKYRVHTNIRLTNIQSLSLIN